MKTIIKLSTIVFLLAACAKTEEVIVNDQVVERDVTIVSVEDALARLDDFLSDAKLKSSDDGNVRLTSSIIPYYGDKTITKSGERIPEAYLVNFENEAGFAVLGANSAVAPIIAVVEEGNTTWDNIMSPQVSEIDEQYETVLENQLLGSGIPHEKLVSMCIKGALYGQGGYEAAETKTGYDIEILPLLGHSYDFMQHHTYCHKDNNKFVPCGCAAVGIAIVFSYIKPTRLVVDTELLSYNNLNIRDGNGTLFQFNDGTDIYINVQDYFTNSSAIPSALSNTQWINILTKIDPTIVNSHETPLVYPNSSFFRTEHKITSGIFYQLDCIIKNWDATGTMPDALMQGLTDLRFTNVNKLRERGLSAGQINTIINMLNDNKPVLMCGWSLGSLSKSHYWVADGIRQSDSETLIHCNWGWGGYLNGWFSSDCLRNGPEESEDNIWNNILVFSYDKPSMAPATYLNDFYSEHRVTY